MIFFALFQNFEKFFVDYQRFTNRTKGVFTPKVESVVWKDGDDSTITDDNPNTGGEKRIFPGKRTPANTVDRRTVKIEATLTHKVEDITVYFKIFDVDDPSSKKKPVDNEKKQYDNRGTKVPVTIFEADTDENGVAEIEFAVSMQPGNNFKTVASVNKDFFTGMKPEHKGRTDSRVLDKDEKPVSSDNITKMLTVWRKVHVEVDNMQFSQKKNEKKGIFREFTGTWTKISKLLSMGNIGDASNGKGRFENGSINIGNGQGAKTKLKVLRSDKTSVRLNKPTFKGLDFLATNKNNDKTITGTVDKSKFVILNGEGFFKWKLSTQGVVSKDFKGGKLNVSEGTGVAIKKTKKKKKILYSSILKIPYLLRDDDKTKGLLVGGADTSLLVAKFKPAYVLPVFDLQNAIPTVPFVRNFPTNAAKMRAKYRFDNKATENDPNFWTVYVLGAFQGPEIKDKDPNSEGAGFGRVDAIGTGQGATVYVEVFNEIKTKPWKNNAITIVHEVGHLFGGRHKDLGIMKQTWERKPQDVHFAPKTLDKIRTIKNP